MRYLTLRTWDPVDREWHITTILPGELSKTLAWKLYLGHQCFKISTFSI